MAAISPAITEVEGPTTTTAATATTEHAPRLGSTGSVPRMSRILLTEKQRPSTVRVVLVGAACGKTCLGERFVSGRFDAAEPYTPTVDSVYRRELRAPTAALVEVIDTASTGEYARRVPEFIRMADAAAAVFSVVDRASFDAALRVLSEEEAFADQNSKKKMKKMPAALVGTKADLLEGRVVTEAEATKAALQLGVPYFEVSAADGRNVEALFTSLAQAVLVPRHAAAAAPTSVSARRPSGAAGLPPAAAATEEAPVASRHRRVASMPPVVETPDIVEVEGPAK